MVGRDDGSGRMATPHVCAVEARRPAFEDVLVPMTTRHSPPPVHGPNHAAFVTASPMPSSSDGYGEPWNAPDHDAVWSRARVPVRALGAISVFSYHSFHVVTTTHSGDVAVAADHVAL